MSEQQCVFGGVEPSIRFYSAVVPIVREMLCSRKWGSLVHSLFKSSETFWQVSQAVGWASNAGFYSSENWRGLFRRTGLCFLQRGSYHDGPPRCECDNRRSAWSRIETLRRSASGMYSNAIERRWVWDSNYVPINRSRNKVQVRNSKCPLEPTITDPCDTVWCLSSG